MSLEKREGKFISHLAEVRTSITDLNLLKSILKDLGFEMEDGKTQVKDMVGKSIEVIAKAKKYQFGIQEVKSATGVKTYNVSGEFYSTNWYNKEKLFADKLNRTFAARKAKQELEALGYTGVQNGQLIEGKDGSIQFVMGKH